MFSNIYLNMAFVRRSLGTYTLLVSISDNEHANQATVSEPDVLHFSRTVAVLKTEAAKVITEELSKWDVKEDECTIMGKPKNNTRKVRFTNGAGQMSTAKEAAKIVKNSYRQKDGK